MMLEVELFILRLSLWEEFRCLHPAHKVDGLLPRPVWPAVHCIMHRGQPALGRHQPVSILVETFGCCCRGSRLIYQQVSLFLPGGSTRAERAGPVVWTGTTLARLTVLTWMGAPLQQSAASALPSEGSHGASCRGKNLSGFCCQMVTKKWRWWRWCPPAYWGLGCDSRTFRGLYAGFPRIVAAAIADGWCWRAEARGEADAGEGRSAVLSTQSAAE